MRPSFHADYPPASPAEIAAFEQLCGQSLPADYRDFLSSINGGESDPPYFLAHDNSVQEVGLWFGLHDVSSDSHLNLFKRWNVGEYLFNGPKSLVCIATGLDGNLLMLNLDPAEAGHLLIWYRELAPNANWKRGPEGETIAERNLRLGLRQVADSFGEFFARAIDAAARDAHFKSSLGGAEA